MGVGKNRGGEIINTTTKYNNRKEEKGKNGEKSWSQPTANPTKTTVELRGHV